MIIKFEAIFQSFYNYNTDLFLINRAHEYALVLYINSGFLSSKEYKYILI